MNRLPPLKFEIPLPNEQTFSSLAGSSRLDTWYITQVRQYRDFMADFPLLNRIVVGDLVGRFGNQLCLSLVISEGQVERISQLLNTVVVDSDHPSARSIFEKIREVLSEVLPRMRLFCRLAEYTRNSPYREPVGFMKDIMEDPFASDRTTSLIFADWLADHGEEQLGDLLRQLM